MKKLLYSALALAGIIAVSCTKEADVQTDLPGTRALSIKAYLGDDTKTAYADEKTFTWLQGDLISLLVSDGSSFDLAQLEAESGGASTNFLGTVADGWAPGGIAVYPYASSDSYEYSYYNGVELEFDRIGTPLASLNSTIYATGLGTDYNPLSLIPLIGQPQNDGSYKFQTATGILKFTFTKVPSTVAAVYLVNEDQSAPVPLSGTFLIDDDGFIKMENTVGGSNGKWVYVDPVEDGGTLTVYIPIPVGTIPAGTEIRLINNSYEIVFSQAFAKDVEVKRNVITNIAALEVPDNSVKASYEDFLGNWEYTSATGSEVWTIAEKVSGQSYSIIGINGVVPECGEVAEAIYDSAKGRFTVSNQVLANSTDKLVAIWTYGNSVYSNEDYMVDPLIFTGVMMNDGTIEARPSADEYGALEGFAYFKGAKTYAGYDALPAVLTPTQATPDLPEPGQEDDPLQKQYFYDDFILGISMDDIAGNRWYLYAAEAHEEEREYWGNVSFTYEGLIEGEDIVSISGLTGGAGEYYGFDDSVTFDLYEGILWSHKDPMEPFTVGGQTYYPLPGYLCVENNYYYPWNYCLFGAYVDEGIIALTPYEEYIAIGYTFTGLFFVLNDENGDYLADLGEIHDILFVNPAVYSSPESALRSSPSPAPLAPKERSTPAARNSISI